MTPPATPPRRRSRALLLAGVLVVLAGAFVVAADMREVARLLDRTDWSRVPPAFLLTAVSYASISAALVALCGPMGVAAPRGPMMRIAFVSFTVNQLISFGGVAGYSLRAVLSKRYGVATGDTLAISLVHSYLNNLAMFVLLAVGILHLVRDPATDEAWRRTLQVGGALVLVFFMISSSALFSARLRAMLVRAGVGLARRLLPGRWVVPVALALHDLDAALGRAANALRRDPKAAWWPCVFLVLDWAAVLGVLWFCLDAVGEPVTSGVLIGGLSIGVVAGFASLIPGGMGVQDGSLAAVLALQGVPLQDAVLGTLLFRLVYYVAPFLATLPVYASFLRRRAAAADEAG